MKNFVVLLNFSGSLAPKSTSLNNEQCLARATLINLNPNELHYYPFMISLKIHNESCSTLIYLVEFVFWIKWLM